MKTLLHYLAVTTVAVFAPVQAAVATALVLVVVDFITGVWASRKRGESFQSSRVKRSVAKLAVYETALVLGFLAETYLTGSYVPCCKLAASFIGLTEFTSVLENLNVISGQNLLKTLIDKLSSARSELP